MLLFISVHATLSASTSIRSNITNLDPKVDRVVEGCVSGEESAVRRLANELERNSRVVSFRDVVSATHLSYQVRPENGKGGVRDWA